MNNITLNKELQGMCLVLGLIGLAYVALLMLVALFTGFKIVKSMMFIILFSASLVTMGLTPQIKKRLITLIKSKVKMLFNHSK